MVLWINLALDAQDVHHLIVHHETRALGARLPCAFCGDFYWIADISDLIRRSWEAVDVYCLWRYSLSDHTTETVSGFSWGNMTHFFSDEELLQVSSDCMLYSCIRGDIFPKYPRSVFSFFIILRRFRFQSP
ncbi:uncharacterized protein A4U43_C01F14390 [Asparagus officinalis]|uniref:Uncharacterized protein n=1 Tax=Asparagus officinalis TaxID=4686 RepID=A0A5P1FPA6_ASPOF|nr:uncharacterized protein A4U43_C01F14390 [Asparagus officinalis]